jgi:hypothetical protein
LRLAISTSPNVSHPDLTLPRSLERRAAVNF